MRFDSAQYRDRPSVVKAYLSPAKGRAVENATRHEPRGDAEHVQIMQSFDLKAGGQKGSSEPGTCVPAEMIERPIQRSENCGQGRNKEEQ